MSERVKKIILYIIITAGAVLSANLLLFCWGALTAFKVPVIGPLLLVYFAACIVLQVFFVWYLYCHFKKREVPDVPAGLPVDVFVTAYNEPMWIVERALKAAKNINYPHRTYLLDDSSEFTYKELAAGLGSEYLTREGNLHFKAGNINAALKRTSGEFVTIFDVDHAPEPEFLDRTLGFFNDERIGFVQVMETFCNSDENLITEASVQTAMEYFNISLACKDRVGACSHHGTNAVVRRKALESIGGYHPGLAEDLETSLSLHSRGWKSAYVCEPLAPGLTPASCMAFFKQQLKWSRGVFEAACRTLLDGKFFKLTWHQRIAYCIRFSYYFVGLSFFLGIVLTLFHLFKSEVFFYEGFLARLLPLTAIMIVIRWFMLRAWATEPMAKKGIHFKGTSLVFSTWPIYLTSLICTIIRIPIPFMSTPKGASSEVNLWTIIPQIFMIAALVTGIIWKILHWQQGPAPITLGVALLLVAQQWILFILIWQRLKNAIRIKGRADAEPEVQATPFVEIDGSEG